jgi:hypothetical protein
VDVRATGDLTIVLLTNLQSSVTWQLRDRLKRLTSGAGLSPIALPPPVAPVVEPPADFVGRYGDPDDPIVIGVVRGRLYRDENEFYPIAGSGFYIPASGATMRFRRDSNGAVDALLTTFGDGRETTRPRLSNDPPAPRSR